MNIGFIGTGVMGKSMIQHLMKEHQLFIYTRTKSKAEQLMEEGAVWVDSPKELCEKCDLIMTMVGYPSDVEEVYFNLEYGLLEYAKKGSILIDFTTSTPSLAKRIYQVGKERGLACLDAPVSGGDVGAKNATLTIMCGGEENTFNQVKDILFTVGNNVQLQGIAGAGQHTKMCNQIAIASTMMGVCESLVYAEAAGLDVEKVLSSISTGAAASASLTNYAPRILKDDLEPGFYIKHFVKDLKIALEEAKKMNLNLPGLIQAKKLYEQMEQDGYGDKGTQALILWYESGKDR